MSLDRRALLISLASSAAMLALPARAAAALRRRMLRRLAPGRQGQFLGRAVHPRRRCAGGRAAAARPRHHAQARTAANGSLSRAVPAGSASRSRSMRARRSGSPPKPERHFFGHGVFSADGRLLYTTENDYERAAGMIGVRDATDGYKQIGEFPAHGLEPHDIALLADGRTMVIANGGIQTHPDRGDDELNLPDMQPSLVYVDVATGDLLEEHRLAPALHQLSIRHLAIARRRHGRVRLPISRAGGGRAGAGRLSSPRRDAGHRRGAGRDADRRCATISARSPPTGAAASSRPRRPRAASSPIGMSPGGAISAPATSTTAAGSRPRIAARTFF